MAETSDVCSDQLATEPSGYQLADSQFLFNQLYSLTRTCQLVSDKHMIAALVHYAM